MSNWIYVGLEDEFIKILFCLLFFPQIGSKVHRLKVKMGRRYWRSEENRRNERVMQKNGTRRLWKYSMTVGK